MKDVLAAAMTNISRELLDAGQAVDRFGAKMGKIRTGSKPHANPAKARAKRKAQRAARRINRR